MKNECYYDDFSRKEGLAFDTKVVHGGMGCDPITGAVSRSEEHTSELQSPS